MSNNSPEKAKENTKNQEEPEFVLDEVFSEPTEYHNTLEIINGLETIKVSELYDYVRDRTDEAFSAEFQVWYRYFECPLDHANTKISIWLNKRIV